MRSLRIISAGPAGPSPAPAFSLLELVLVMAILAVVSAIAMPRMAQASARYRVETAARRVAADLNLARTKALSASTSQSVVFTLSPAGYRLVGLADIDHPAQEYQVSLSAQPYTCELLQAGFAGSTSVLFDGYGRPNSGGTIELRCGGWNKILTLEASGEVSGL